MHFERGQQIVLLFLFDKNEKEDLTQEDKKALSALAEECMQSKRR